MKKSILLFLIMLLTITLTSCAKKAEIDEEKLKQFVIEYDDALSKGWSECDDIFVPWVTRKYLWEDAFLDHYSNEKWFIYEDSFEILSVEKNPRKEYRFWGNNSYTIKYQRKAIGKIVNDTIVKLPSSNEYGYSVVCVAPINGKLLVTGYTYSSCWVKEKHLPALIKRKGLVVEK